MEKASFFSINILKNDKLKVGRVDIKTMRDIVLVHISVSELPANYKYDLYFLFGENGEDGNQKAYIITNKFGKLNDTIRFTQKNTKQSLESFANISCIVFIPQDRDENLEGFRGEKFDYEQVIKNGDKNEYIKNEKFDKIIDSEPKYNPFLEKINNLDLVKIDRKTFEDLNLTCLRQNLINFIVNSIKIYGFLTFGRYLGKKKIVYILGIPDKFNPNQTIAMVNMGSRRFYGINFSKHPENGDLGFWIVYL
ncbi:MAG: hypothetical protein LBK29_01860 [Oscillospiraceae bacterium]|jgi:hypothetical protein|nr:hypothetical protein [Oscillospiraceae bacterium]